MPTVRNGPLSKEQITSFNENGFLHVRNFLSKDQVQELRSEMLRAVKEGIAWKKTKYGQTGYGIQDLFNKLPKTKWLSREPRLMAMLKQLLGNDIADINDNGAAVGLVNKVWHKDNEYYTREEERKGYELDWKPDYKVTRAVYYLQEHKKHSGALGVKAGSHKIQNLKGGKPVIVDNDAGDLIIFDTRLTHAGNVPVPKPAFNWISTNWLRPDGYHYKDYDPIIPKIIRKTKIVFQDIFCKLPIFYPYYSPQNEPRILITTTYGANNWQSQRWVDYLKTTPMGSHTKENKITPIK